MSRSAWDGPSLDGDVDSNPNGSSSLSRQTSVSISRSQDDATVSYYFQRPQSENDLQAYGGGKRWAIGDDMLVEQAKSVSDLEREFHNISLGSDFSTKKFWEIDDGHVSDGKGTMFTASSPWSPRQSTWSSPTTDNNVAQSLQSFQPVSLAPDAMPYGLGDHITKNFSGLRSLKNEFVHDTDNDIIKTPKKTSKTSSPFEPVENKNNVDNQNDLLHNGDDGFRVLRMESPLAKLRDDEPVQIGPQKAIGSTPTKKQQPSSHSESFAPILNHTSAMGQLNVSQSYSRLGNMAGTLDALSFADYSVPSLPTIDSPAANQFSGLAPPLDYNPNSMMAQQNFAAMSTSQAYSQQQQQPSLYSMNSVNMNLQQPPQQPPLPPPPPQQQPLQTPVGQANQVPFNMFNQQQTQYGVPQQAAQQQTPSQQQMAPAGAAMNVPNSMNNTTSTQQQPMTVLPHPSASFMINGQDPHAMGMAMGPFQYVQTPWGIFPASVITSHQPMTGQQQNPQSQASQRPLTPNQQQQQLGNQATDGLPAQQQQINAQQVQMAPNFIDMSNGYPTTPTILAFYDQNGHLVTVNNGRSIPATPVRLVSPAPFIYNPGPNNMQQPPQGFGGAAPANFTSSNGAPPSVNNMNGVSAVNSMHTTNMQTNMPANMQALNQQLSMSSNSNTNSFPQTMNIPNSDFAVPQRQDSFSGPSDKYGMYGGGSGNMNMASTPAGPLGLVQPPPPPVTPPALGGTTGLGLGLGSGGRLYNAAPGAEATYRNSLGPHTMPSSMANPSGGSGGGGVFTNRPSKENVPMSRSRLLEEFRGNRLPNLQLKDLNHHVVEFSQDQHGSRFIQQKLERASVVEKQLVFNEILSAAYSLMTDVFGNYVIQKFFEFGLPDHKQMLAQKLNGQVLPLALQMYGCRVIQKALESIPSEMQIAIVNELDGHVLKCVKDQNGNHVVQKCIECVEPNHLQFIIDAFHGQVYLLSTHPYGCRVIQRILEHCVLEQTAVILSELHEQTDRLVLDQYGNYVIQHVLEHGRMEEKSKIVSHIRGKVLPLSQHKFASNVVEKCVSHSSRAEKAILIEEVCSASESGQSALYIMMKDQYANYVIQKMLDIAEPNQRKILVHKIRPHIATLRKYTYGKHIIAKLEKYLMKNGGGDLSSGSPLGLSM